MNLKTARKQLYSGEPAIFAQYRARTVNVSARPILDYVRS